MEFRLQPTGALGSRIGEAADFLVNLLAGREMPSVEVFRHACEAGISDSTLGRAKAVVKAKSERKNSKWYMSVPEEMKGRIFSTPKPQQTEYLLRPTANQAISSDWVSVAPQDDDCAKHKIDIPIRVPPTEGLHIKVGAFEFKADAGFPADKLAEVLRELAVRGG